MEYLLSYQQTKMSHLSVIPSSANVNFWKLQMRGARVLWSFATQRIQACHCPSLVGGVRFSPWRQAIMHACNNKSGKIRIKAYMQNRKRDTDVQNRLLNSGRRPGWDVLREQHRNMYIIKGEQITSPGWMHETSARGWCTGKTQRDGVGREVGGGIGIGNTCKSMADSCQCMAKTTTIL